VISVFIAQSLDGYIATDDDSLDWLTSAGSADDDYGFANFIEGIDVVAMGRSTYEFIKDVEELPYGDRPVHVFTSRDASPRVGFEFYARTPQDAMRYWEENGIEHVYLDGGVLISQFLEAGLIDEIIITTVPLLLGSGKELFHRIRQTTPLTLVGSSVFGNGFVQTHYRRG
jgi:dihydrofolate reductase